MNPDSRARARVIGLVPTRMDSRRLPGKPLRPLDGRPLLDRVMGRVQRSAELDYVAIATTARAVDAPLVDHARARGWKVFFGDVDDVAGRLLGAAAQAEAAAFLRLNGDSPFLDPELLDQGIRRWREGDVDFVTNIVDRTYPYGISVEVIGAAAYQAAYARFTEPGDREHVTAYWYRNPGAVKVAVLRSMQPALGAARLVVDTPEDAQCMEHLLRRLGPDADRASFQVAAQAYLDMMQQVAAGRTGVPAEQQARNGSAGGRT